MRHAQSTFAINAKIRDIAATQLGLITVDQAQTAGVNRNALARRRAVGALVPVFREVMRLVPFPTTPMQRALAGSLVVPGSVIAASSAAIVHQLPVPAGHMNNDDVVLSVTAGRVVRVPGIKVVRQTSSMPCTRWLTTHVSTPAATLLLLPRFATDEIVERCLDHALAHRMCTVANLNELLLRLQPQGVYKRGLLLDLVADRSNGIGHRSGKEQLVARWLRKAGLTGWTRNLKVSVDSGPDEEVEVDFGWQRKRLALEVSPFFTHGSRQKQERDAQRRGLLVLADWRIVEALDDDIDNERAFARIVKTLRALDAT